MIHQEEILFDILCRLPAKSIGRFRCVSKAWRSLLTQPYFIKTHLYRTKHLLNQQEESLILVSGDSSASSLHIAQLNNAHHVFDEITTFATKLCFGNHNFEWTSFNNICSIDGLIFVCDEEDNMSLVNPTTREVREIPKSQDALDSHASITTHGVGYDSASDDYKVVAISYRYPSNLIPIIDHEMFVDVYSVKNNTWKRVESSPYYHAGPVTAGVSVGGCIHWLVSRKTPYISTVIVAFDLGEERFREVSPPIPFNKGKFVYDLVVLGGCLCIFSRETEDAWVMKEYGVKESWTKFKIKDNEGSEFILVGSLTNEQVVLQKDVETPDEKLMIYNLKEKSFKNIIVNGIPDEIIVRGTFMESLVSPNVYNIDAMEEC